MKTKFINFIKESKSFTYKVGDVFTYDELPREVKKDVVTALITDEVFDETDPDPAELKYEIVIIPYDELMEWLDNVYGAELNDMLDDDYIIELSEDIKENGLKYPIIFGYDNYRSEGHHRALAFALLKKPIPSIKFIYPNK